MRNAEDMENHEDPDLAAAYAAENEGIRLDRETLGYAWMFGIIPVALVLLLLSALIGEWVWKLLPTIFIAVMVFFAVLPLLRRYQSDLPIPLPGHGTFRGEAKKRLLIKAMVFVALVVLAYVGLKIGFPMLRDWVTSWTIQL